MNSTTRLIAALTAALTLSAMGVAQAANTAPRPGQIRPVGDQVIAAGIASPGEEATQPGEPFFPPGWRRPGQSNPPATDGTGGPGNDSVQYTQMNCVPSGHEKDAMSDLEFWNTGTTVIPAGTVITWTTSEGKTGTLTVPLDLKPGEGMEIWNVVADGWSSAFGCDVTLSYA